PSASTQSTASSLPGDFSASRVARALPSSSTQYTHLRVVMLSASLLGPAVTAPCAELLVHPHSVVRAPSSSSSVSFPSSPSFTVDKTPKSNPIA
ncbi:unnamed protein product, partial [Oikopleura dioica]